jgi:hypothetical protein
MRRLIPLLAAILVAAPVAAATPQLDREIERLRAELVDLGRAEQAGQGESEALRARLEMLNAREAAVRGRIDRNREQLARLLGALQMQSRHPPPPLLVNPRSARDAVRAAILLRAITPQLEARGRVFAEQAEAVARVRREAAVASEGLFRAESDVADRRTEIRSDRGKHPRPRCAGRVRRRAGSGAGRAPSAGRPARAPPLRHPSPGRGDHTVRGRTGWRRARPGLDLARAAGFIGAQSRLGPRRLRWTVERLGRCSHLEDRRGLPAGSGGPRCGECRCGTSGYSRRACRSHDVRGHGPTGSADAGRALPRGQERQVRGLQCAKSC